MLLLLLVLVCYDVENGEDTDTPLARLHSWRVAALWNEVPLTAALVLSYAGSTRS